MKIEKVELVKRLIRENNYRQYEKTHQQCLELGININRAALDRFADKLELIDKAERARCALSHTVDVNIGSAPASQPTPAYEPSNPMPTAPAPTPAMTPVNPVSYQQNTQQTRIAVSVDSMTYEQLKQREAEITFELGALKIRESELLKELSTLSDRLNIKN